MTISSRALPALLALLACSTSALAQSPATPLMPARPAKPATTPSDKPPEPAPAPEPGEPGKVLTTETVIKPAAPAKPGAPAAIATADDLLTALETADRGIHHLAADLTHTNRPSELIGDKPTIKRGKLYFQNARVDQPNGARRFQVDFTEVEFDNKRLPESQSFVFDGRWLVDRHPKDRQQFKYELAAPGQTTDPLAIGEGPFPIPIGQKKDRILDRFTCELLAGDKDFPIPPNIPNFKPPQWAIDSYQLKLTPRPGSREARDFNSVSIWYRKADLLPQMAKTMKTDDTSDEILLLNTVKDGTLPAGLFDTSKPEGWQEQVEPMKPIDGQPVQPTEKPTDK